MLRISLPPFINLFHNRILNCPQTQEMQNKGCPLIIFLLGIAGGVDLPLPCHLITF